MKQKLSLFILVVMLLSSCKKESEGMKMVENTGDIISMNTKATLLPKINKSEFYKTTGFDFGYLIFEGLRSFCKNKEPLEVAKEFTKGQKALYFWFVLDFEVRNGGFDQFYYNEDVKYMTEVIAGLEYIGDKKVLALIKEIHQKYLNKEKIENTDISKGIENSHNYSFAYLDLNEDLMSLFETYIKNNPSEFCVDENGNEIQRISNSTVKNYYDDGSLKEGIDIENNIINGLHIVYYKNGLKKSEHNYVNGVQEKKQTEWYENGELKEEVYIHSKTKNKDIKLYYDNGQISESKHTDPYGNSKKGSKEWYKNGNLKEELTYHIFDDNKNGVYNTFWENGTKQSEIEFINNERFIHNYWNEKGENLLKDGTGLFIREYTLNIYEPEHNRNEEYYLNHKLHGISKSYRDGELENIGEYKNGKKNGVHQWYYKNGNLEEEEFFDQGVKKYKKEYFENGQLSNEYILHNGKIVTKHTEYAKTGKTSRITTVNAKTLERIKQQFYESGAIDFEIKYVNKNGLVIEHMTKYWENGNKKNVQKEISDPNYEIDTEYFLIDSWMMNGDQMVKDGEGLAIYNYSSDGITYRTETTYSNYKQNGDSKGYENNILKKTTVYKNDKEISTIEH